MKQQAIKFEEVKQIPESHLKAIICCNSASNFYEKQSFYRLKSKLLHQFAYCSDHDLQTIIKKCNCCGGTGKFICDWKPREMCFQCLGSGIYQTKKVVLKRWILNNALFHEPIGELYGENKLKVFNGYDEGYPTFEYVPFYGTIKNEIHGIITHKETENNPRWAFYYLLWNYDRLLFYKCLSSFMSSHSAYQKRKLQKTLKTLNPLNALSQYFNVKSKQLADIEDLPF